MFSSDRENGKVILTVTSLLFLYYTVSIIASPFIDDDRLRSLFCTNNLALIAPAISGLCFIGGLIIFTLYHVRPYLHENGQNNN